MIKIRLSNVYNLQQEYDRLVRPEVIKRIIHLKTALEQILGNQAVQPPAANLSEVSKVIQRIIKISLKKVVLDNRFVALKYRRTVLFYSGQINAVANIELQAVLDIIDQLADQTTGKLEELITCLPDELFNTNEDWVTKPKKLRKIELEVVKLAFDYQLYSNVTDKIKFFFRAKNFVNYCPYCNLDPAMYSGLSNGSSVRVHQLDHFFDKASNPLLCYSMFNLVPGDWNCNSINKRSKPFDDAHHLNPYIDGFGKTMVFEPELDKAGKKIVAINLRVDAKANKKRRIQLLGSKLAIDSTEKQGNINVFALKEKYNLDHIQLEAGRVRKKFLDNLNNRSSLKDLLKLLQVKDAYDQYKFWYEEEIRAPFRSAKFNEQRYSKLFRDIHDFVVKMDADPDNKIIQTITKKYE